MNRKNNVLDMQLLS